MPSPPSSPRAVLLASGLAVAACHPTPTPHAAARPQPTTNVATRAAPAVAGPAPQTPATPVAQTMCGNPPLVALRALTPSREAYARRVLYTWTTEEQARGLRRGGALLTRATSPEHGASVFEVVLAFHASRGNEVARLLTDARFHRARFAWVSPWPTRCGWEGEAYGDHLVRVTLRPEAWTVRFTTRGEMDARDMGNAPVPLEALRAHPERIGAVFFTQDGLGAMGTMMPFLARRFSASESAHHREYVLPNEAMIESWELDTATIRRDVDDAVATVTAMRTWLDTCEGRQELPSVDGAREAWREEGDGDDVGRAWIRALALANSRYALTRPNLDALIDVLRATPDSGGRRVVNVPGRPRLVLDPHASENPAPHPPPAHMIGTYILP